MKKLFLFLGLCTTLFADSPQPSWDEYKNRFGYFGLGASITLSGTVSTPDIGLGYRWQKKRHIQDIIFAIEPNDKILTFLVRWQYSYQFGMNPQKGVYIGPVLGIMVHRVDWRITNFLDHESRFFDWVPSASVGPVIGYKFSDKIFLQADYAVTAWETQFITIRVGLGF